METRQLPAPQQQEEQATQHPLVTLVCIGMAVCWLLVFIAGIGINKGAWWSWWTVVIIGGLVAIGAGLHVSHEKYKAHQLHQEDIADRAHHRVMTQLAIQNDHSAEHITRTSSFRTISKYMGPTTVNIKDNTLGQQQQLAAATQQPSLDRIIGELTPNALQFAYGVDTDTGQLVTTTLQKAVHIQLLGATGQGKSHQAMSILTQLFANNDPEHLQLASIDCEGETSQPFWGLPHVRFLADSPKEAARILSAIVEELNRRDEKKQVWPMILVFVEEFLNLRRIMPVQYRDQALEDYTTIALRGRKRGIFLFSIGQTSYTEKAIRDAQMQFMSSMAFAIKPSAARSAGFTNTDLLNRLYSERKPGQFLLERPAGDGILLAPYVESSSIPGLLSSFQVTSNDNVIDEFGSHLESTWKAETKTDEAALDARSRRILDLIKQGVPQSHIIREVWNVKAGSAYTKAGQELADILKNIFQ